MKANIVGGFVRDMFLGRALSDKDWVVTEATHDDMIKLGFKSVGQSFPVYLHPQSNEEYALARQERKVASGHSGFDFNTANISLEEDLMRRDLTINAMALDENGQLIDPYGGYRDLQSLLLRHVSQAFQEDPLRVLRIARFAAQLGHLKFHIADSTLVMMKKICESGELQTLPPERVLQETLKALNSNKPSLYFQILRQVGALKIIFPEVDALFGVPQNEVYHPEIDTGVHVMMVLDQAARLCMPEIVRFACLCHDFGKGITPQGEWPSHKNHELKGVPLVRQMCNRLKVEKKYQRLALLVCEYHLLAHKMFDLRPATIIKLLNNLDAWRRPETVRYYMLACEADSRGRTGFEKIKYSQKDLVMYLVQQIHNTQLKIDSALQGEGITQFIFDQRCRVAQRICADWMSRDRE